MEIQYERNDIDFHRGTFRVRGDIVEIFPPYEEERAYRVEFFGDTIDGIALVDPLRGKKLGALSRLAVYPGSHYVTTRDNLVRAVGDIRAELAERLAAFQAENKLLEAQRLEQRTHFDIEMMEEHYCQGSRTPPPDGAASSSPTPEYLEGRLVVIDEPRGPQLIGIPGTAQRALVNYGFRLPSPWTTGPSASRVEAFPSSGSTAPPRRRTSFSGRRPGVNRSSATGLMDGIDVRP